MKKVITILITFSMAFSLCACGRFYTDEEINDIYQRGYKDGFDEGAVEGCSHLYDYFVNNTDFVIACDEISIAYDHLDEMLHAEELIEEDLLDIMSLLEDAMEALSRTGSDVANYTP